MKAAEPDFQQLDELYTRRELAVFLGPDLPQSLTGTPSWSDLAERLAERGGWRAMSSWPQVAARYERAFGRANLIDWLDNQISNGSPGLIYPRLARLSVDTYITVSYDGLLQSALAAGGRPANVIAADADLGFVRPERPTVVKLFGQISAGRKETLLLTEGEIVGLPLRRAKIVAQEVQPVLSGRSLLIMGQDMRESFFRDLFHRSALQFSVLPLRRPSFAVWSALEKWEVDEWAEEQVRVLEVEPLDLIRRLLREA